MSSRIILHSDMNNCYASIEQKLNPALVGKPMIVCGSRAERHGIVLAKSMEAKACGIVTGEPIWQAHEKCPGLVEVPPHFDAYLSFSRAARRIYAQYTDLVEPYGLDECWLDVTGSTRLFGSGEEIAEKIRTEIREKLGITVSIGVSFNKIFAKIGSDLKKPDAVTVISQQNFRQKLWPLPVGTLWGVGPATERRLVKFGIRTIGQLAMADRDAVSRAVGKGGAALCGYAAGEDCSPVMPLGWRDPIKSVGHGMTATRDLVNNEEVWLMIYHLAQDVSHRLNAAGMAAGGVSVAVRDQSMGYAEFQGKTPVPVLAPLLIAKAAHRLFTGRYDWSRPVRAVTVRAINLCPQGQPVQTSLFASPLADERSERLFQTVEQLRGRYGKNAVMAASLCQRIAAAPHRENKIQLPGIGVRH